MQPASFLPIAEQTDVIFELTSWVMQSSMAALAELPADVAVAINVSARSLATPEFASSVIQAMKDSGAPANRVILEVTETALLTDPPRAAEILRQLASLGVRISLDDFGSGQTSLGYLASLPLHELKIDRSFVSDMLHNPAHAAIVASIVELGHNLSLKVVGEGVEDATVLEHLATIGCDDAQGYLIARPAPLAEVVSWIASTRQPGPSDLGESALVL
ncbi:MAG: EAL domain-containing protein [Acidimicrobiales bacterium]